MSHNAPVVSLAIDTRIGFILGCGVILSDRCSGLAVALLPNVDIVDGIDDVIP